MLALARIVWASSSVAHLTNSSAAALFLLPVGIAISSPPANDALPPSLPTIGAMPKSTFAFSNVESTNAPSWVIPTLPLENAVAWMVPASVLTELGITPSSHIWR